MSLFKESVKTSKLAGPIILGELVQMSLHLIDSAMVGAISYTHLAGASLVLSLMAIPVVFCIGMTISIAQMASLYNGQHKNNHVSHYFFNGTILSVLVAVVISLSLYFGSGIVYHLNQEYEVAVLAEPFLKLLALSIVPMTLFLSCKQLADGLEMTQVAMVITILGVPLNILLNWFLIYGNGGMPRLELEGAGWGTLITRSVMFVVILVYLLRNRRFKQYWQSIPKFWFLSGNSIKKLSNIGIPTALQIVMETGAFAVSGIMVGMIGAKEQASHQIALNVASFTFMVSMGLSQASSIRISKYFGLKDHIRISEIGRSTLLMALMYGLFCAVFYTLFRYQIPEYFNKDMEVVNTAATLLILAAVFQIPDALQAIGAGVLRGMRDIRMPTVYIALAYWVFGVPVGYYLAFVMQMKAVGIWIGFIVGLSFVAVALVVRFLRRSRRGLSVAGTGHKY